MSRAEFFTCNIGKVRGLNELIILESDSKYFFELWTYAIGNVEINEKTSTSTLSRNEKLTEIMDGMIGNYLRWYSTFHQDNRKLSVN